MTRATTGTRRLSDADAGPAPNVSPATAAEHGEVPALTSLRMIAAWLVFVHHYPPSSAGLWGVVSRQGHVGVTVFFVLSGFLITVRYFRAWSERRLRLRDYFKKRAARILPLYFVVLALSLWISGQPFDVRGRRLPEWTMTQGFFWDSLYHAAIPTSWSLTVEECFYALAPLVFLAVAAAGGLRRRGGWVAVLGTGVAVLLAAGVGLVRYSRHAGLAQQWHGFVADQRHMVIYTIFGRFMDFAVGIGCGLAYLRGDIARLWRRPEGRRLSNALFVLAVALMLAALTGMDGAGGVFGARYLVAWKYNLGVVAASALTIVALTSPGALASRVLAAAPLVYLGKISYALYLIQMSPAGTRALFGLTLAPRVVHVVVLYAAMNVVSALLYELVEKPGRAMTVRAADVASATADAMAARTRAVLRHVPLWSRGQAFLPSALAAAAVAAILLAEICLGSALLLGARPSPSLREALQAAPPGSPALLTASLRKADPRGEDLRRVPLPAQWSTGAASPLLVFVDGAEVPFSVGEPAAAPRPVYAYTRQARAGSVLIRCPPEEACTDAVILRRDGALRRAIGVRRLARAPLLVAALVALGVTWALLIASGRGRGATLHPWSHVALAVVALAIGTGWDLGATGALAALAGLGTAWLAVPLFSARTTRTAAAAPPPRLD